MVEYFLNKNLPTTREAGLGLYFIHNQLSYNMNIFERAKHLLSLKLYQTNTFELPAIAWPMLTPKNQYILRMLIKSPDLETWAIPEELQWLENTVKYCARFQDQHFSTHSFVYVTVRSGKVLSVTDDIWHVDGFSKKISHIPEQNYIWTDTNPTEVLDQNFTIPKDFDPSKHNLHDYFQKQANNQNIRTLSPNTLYTIDPYIIHRRPLVSNNTERCFFRISFVPIEIQDDTNTHNPLLKRKYYNNKDIRKILQSYK